MTILCAAHLEPMYVIRASEWSMDLYACTAMISTSETGTVRLCKGRHVSDVSEGIMVRDPAQFFHFLFYFFVFVDFFIFSIVLFIF